MIENLKILLNKQVLEVPLYQYLVAFAVFVVIFVILKIVAYLILKRFKIDKLDDGKGVYSKILTFFVGIGFLDYFLISIYFPLTFVVKNPNILLGVKGVFMFVIYAQLVRFVLIFLQFSLEKYAEKSGRDIDQARSTFLGLQLFIKLFLWAIGVLLILANLGFDVNSLVASLGIGGVAVALAVQNILGDIFSSFSLFLDKPFSVGDFISIGEESGTVKKIGLKTTRLITPQGQELVVSNKELTTIKVQNFKKMEQRRVTFVLGFVYTTSGEKLKKIPQIVKNVVEKIEDLKFDRVHFMEFGAYSLNFECSYLVTNPSLAKYMDTRHEVNLMLKDSFEKEGIEMAFPTQTLQVVK